MKTIFLSLAMTAVLVGCSSNKAEDQIKDYIRQNINDPASYEPVSFGEQQTDSTKSTDDGVINMLEDSVKYYDREKMIATYDDSLSKMYAMQDSVLDREIKYLHSYKNKPCGYKISHVFRRKNKAGGIVLDSINFRFDSSMILRDMGYKKQLNKD